MPTRTVFGFLSPRSMKSKEEGRKLFEAMSSRIPSLLPHKYDDAEPISRVFSLSKLENALQMWGNGFLWCTNKPKSIGGYYSGTDFDLHDAVYISIEGDQIDSVALVDLLQEVASLFKISLGYIHRIYKQEKLDLEFYKKNIMPFNQGLTTHDLRKGIPGICWAMYFGEPYLGLFERNRLLSTPVVIAKEIANGVYLQLTKDIVEPEENYNHFSKVRENVIQHLDSSAFVNSGYEQKNIPEFVICT